MTPRTQLGWAIAMLVGLLAFGIVGASADPPTLTDLEKATLENRLLAVELAQARLDAFIAAHTVPGYALTRAGDYIKQPEPAKVTP